MVKCILGFCFDLKTISEILLSSIFQVVITLLTIFITYQATLRVENRKWERQKDNEEELGKRKELENLLSTGYRLLEVSKPEDRNIFPGELERVKSYFGNDQRIMDIINQIQSKYIVGGSFIGVGFGDNPHLQVLLSKLNDQYIALQNRK